MKSQNNGAQREEPQMPALTPKLRRPRWSGRIHSRNGCGVSIEIVGEGILRNGKILENARYESL
jgi:hypothetical protein